jgi:hypothetical protein
MNAYAHKYCYMFINDDLLLERLINNIENADKYEGVEEKKEDEDKDVNINMNTHDNIV